MVKITMINSKKRNSSHAKTQLQETKTLIIHSIGACGVVGHYEEWVGRFLCVVKPKVKWFCQQQKNKYEI